MRILFLCNKSPWPPKEGGPMAMNMLIEGLIHAGHLVKVLAVNTYKYKVSAKDIPVAYQEKTGIELVEVDLRMKPFKALINLLTDESYHVTRFISNDFREKVIQVLKSGKFDIVQLESLFMAPYIATIRANSSARIVLRAHNIEHLIWERIARETANPVKQWYICHLARTLRNYEDRIVFQVDGIIPITSTDAKYFEGVLQKTLKDNLSSNYQSSEFKQPLITEIPFGLEITKYEHPEVEVEFPSLFSLGSMNWIPNEEGIKWFIEKVWPDVHKHFPELKYYIAGRAMPDWMKSLNVPNVVVVGEVEEASRFLAEKSIMIAPVFSGSGIRVKIIEGMAAGKTIISTTLGAEGINCTYRKNILLADSPCEFFEMISISVSDPDTCRKIGTEAKHLIQSSYQPATLIQKLGAFYEQLLR